MSRKSIAAMSSSIIAEVKSMSVKKKIGFVAKHLCFVFVFCMFFAAYPAYSQNKTVKKDNTVKQDKTVKLEIKRSFYALDENKPEDMGSRDGDYTYFMELEDGGTAGFLYKAKPREAIYVLWGGKVIAGPLTTAEQVKKITEILSDQMKDEHEMRMTIINKFPSGKF